MTGDFVALNLSEQQLKAAIELNKKFAPSYIPYLSIRILNHYNEESFDGLICNAALFNEKECLTKYNSESSKIVNDYDAKNKQFFTFDGLRFFEIINRREASRIQGLFIFTFKYLNRIGYFDKDTAFMIMPFKYDTLNIFYKKSIKIFLKESNLGIDVYRSDDFTGSDVIADTIMERIKKAEFIICDITNCNKNVFFEIGYAKGLNKDIIFLLEQNKPAEFFDVNHIRRIEYSYDRQEEFQAILQDTIISIRNNRN